MKLEDALADVLYECNMNPHYADSCARNIVAAIHLDNNPLDDPSRLSVDSETFSTRDVFAGRSND